MARQHCRQMFKFMLKLDTTMSGAAKGVNKSGNGLRQGWSGCGGGVSHPLAGPCVFLNHIPHSFARPASPTGLFSESHPSATSYSNGLTGEEESASAHGRGEMASVVIDGPMARAGSWVYEPEQIRILTTRPPGHARRIKNYLTMYYVGDLSGKKDEPALPRGHNHNLRWRETLPAPLSALKQGPTGMDPLLSLWVHRIRYSILASGL